MYLTAKLQPWHVPHFLHDLSTAESMVANMSWDAILAQQLVHAEPQQPAVRCVSYRSATFAFTADAGKVFAHPHQPDQLDSIAPSYRRTPLSPICSPPPSPTPNAMLLSQLTALRRPFPPPRMHFAPSLSMHPTGRSRLVRNESFFKVWCHHLGPSGSILRRQRHGAETAEGAHHERLELPNAFKPVLA